MGRWFRLFKSPPILPNRLLKELKSRSRKPRATVTISPAQFNETHFVCPERG